MARGRLAPGVPSEGLSTETEPCRVSVQYDENGTLAVSVTATGAYLDGGRVSATIEGEDIPEDLRGALRDALEAIIDEAHDDLKEEFQRERANALGIHMTAQEAARRAEAGGAA